VEDAHYVFHKIRDSLELDEMFSCLHLVSASRLKIDQRGPLLLTNPFCGEGIRWRGAFMPHHGIITITSDVINLVPFVIAGFLFEEVSIISTRVWL
jgi:hypothetical protein